MPELGLSVSSVNIGFLKGLATNYREGEGGGLQNGGGECEFLPLRKGGSEKVLG